MVTSIAGTMCYPLDTVRRRIMLQVTIKYLYVYGYTSYLDEFINTHIMYLSIGFIIICFFTKQISYFHEYIILRAYLCLVIILSIII